MRTSSVRTCVVIVCALTAILLLFPVRQSYAQTLATLGPAQPASPGAGLLTNVKAISLGFAQTCALTEDGAVLCWGQNEEGNLGNGMHDNSAAPVHVLRLNGGVQAISLGGSHACALTEAGRVWCWGHNMSGQLGDGTAGFRSVPVEVIGLSGVTEIAAGNSHTCALTQDGRVFCWGSNLYGQLGGGYGSNRWTPGFVTGLTDVKAIAAGGGSTCALTTNGALKCWGYNGYGELGDGTQTDRYTPVAVQGLASGVAAVTMGSAHTCAVTSAGALLCWGYNNEGQLGVPVDGPFSIRTTPTPVEGLAADVASVAGGGSHTCARKSTGDLLCWGYNFYGQLGDGTAVSRYAPGTVIGLDGDVAAVSPGYWHTCALLTTGQVQCWGANSAGQLGAGSTPNPHVAASVYGMSSGVIDAAAGGAHSCAVVSDGGVSCWGYNDYGQLGYAGAIANPVAAPVSALTSGVQAIVSGEVHNCVLTEAGGVKCWGDNTVSQLGTSISVSQTTPVDVPGLTSGVTALSAGSYFTCARLQSGLVKCWGRKLKNGPIVGTGPVAVAGLTNVVALGTGLLHACTVLQEGSVRCWGLNYAGQLGDGTRADHDTPVEVIGLKGHAIAVAAGFEHSCALLDTGGVQCWRSNRSGQLGDGTTTDRLAPVDVVGLASGVTAVAAYGARTCALIEGGGVKCWGANYYGSLGDGTITERWTPVDVHGLTSGVAAVTLGQFHSCAVTEAGALKCWGNDNFGALGTAPAWRPLDVVSATPMLFNYFPVAAR